MKIMTFWRFPYQQQQMFFINFFLCGIARASINLMNHNKLAPYFGTSCRMTIASTLISQTQIQQAMMIGHSIKLAARYTPWNSSCLTQAMVAKFWCQHYKIPYMFFIGLAKDSLKPLGEDAHAWITTGPIAITGGYCFNTHLVLHSYTNVTIQPNHMSISMNT